MVGADEPGSQTVGTLTQITPRGRQQVLGGVKCRGRSRRSPRDTKLRKGARIGPRCVGLALIRPRAGATVSGGATLSRKKDERGMPCTRVRVLLLRKDGRTEPPDKCPKLLRPRTRAAHLEMRRKSYTELSEEGTLGEKGGKANLISVM